MHHTPNNNYSTFFYAVISTIAPLISYVGLRDSSHFMKPTLDHVMTTIVFGLDFYS